MVTRKRLPRNLMQRRTTLYKDFAKYTDALGEKIDLRGKMIRRGKWSPRKEKTYRKQISNYFNAERQFGKMVSKLATQRRAWIK